MGLIYLLLIKLQFCPTPQPQSLQQLVSLLGTNENLLFMLYLPSVVTAVRKSVDISIQLHLDLNHTC